jgi:CRP-like cAMP-binding protein
MAILEDEPRSATVTASTDCDLYEINKKDLLALGERRPDIGYRIILRIAEVLCSRLRKSNRDILKLTTALSISLSRGGQR